MTTAVALTVALGLAWLLTGSPYCGALFLTSVIVTCFMVAEDYVTRKGM